MRPCGHVICGLCLHSHSSANEETARQSTQGRCPVCQCVTEGTAIRLFLSGEVDVTDNALWDAVAKSARVSASKRLLDFSSKRRAGRETELSLLKEEQASKYKRADTLISLLCKAKEHHSTICEQHRGAQNKLQALKDERAQLEAHLRSMTQKSSSGGP
ncbi:hypothetical protein GSI_03113 [Ganoderma sinense ZZ0214-1]|uniref:RING-type domain-containing protein n=1 Tax=Ganoderma sinense ZZ0214-1 TaxID=1077348 RepID=A0A2G8SL90_9APHY|nr:hypothetical protein GSI_03113 [Ganoderma sinense ZZ0214-1]